MLKSKPIGDDEVAIEKWEATNRMTIEIFKAFWQKVSPRLSFPGMQAGDDASFNEWEGKGSFGEDCKFQGMRKLGGGQKHGIARAISNDGRFIEEATYCDDKVHGLSFTWRANNTYTAFTAEIYDHGEIKAGIDWEDDWSEAYSEGNKEMILMNNGLNIFKP